MLRLALLGDSKEATVYERLLPRLKGATLVASARDEDELFGGREDEFDAVVIRSAAELHEAQATRAAKAGKHVLVNSRLAPDTESAERLAAACERADVRLMIGHSLRFLPSIRAMYDSLETGQLGDPGLLRIHQWRPRSVADGLDPKTCPADREGACQIANEVDLACWFFGSVPNVVYASGVEPTIDNHDATCLQLHLGFETGGMALIDFSNALPPGDGYFSVSLIGSTGAAYADDHHNMHLLYGGGRPAAVIGRQGDAALLAELSEFVAAIDQQRTPSCTAIDGLRVLRVCGAVAASLAEGKPARCVGSRYEI